MLHTPLTEEQALMEREHMFTDNKKENEKPFVVGDCEFEIYKAIEETKIGKDGNAYQQFVITMHVYDINGTHKFVNSWIPEKLTWKMRELYESIDRLDLYEKESLDAELLISCDGKLTCFEKTVRKEGEEPKIYVNVKKFLKRSDIKKDDMVDDDIPF